MQARRSEIPRLQSDFYRLQLHKLLRWLLIAVGFIFLLLLLIIYFIVFQPEQKYFANTTEGKILEMTNYVSGTR